ncbi:MAG: hypothetical protein RLZZ240_710, partial [Actinomycetota bacterium]
VAGLDVPYVLMHWRGHSTVMDELANYQNVVEEVISELKIQIEKATKAGINRNKIVIDPGLGFAKNPEHNWQITFARFTNLYRSFSKKISSRFRIS